jgi:hypothetical protein
MAMPSAAWTLIAASARISSIVVIRGRRDLVAGDGAQPAEPLEVGAPSSFL